MTTFANNFYFIILFHYHLSTYNKLGLRLIDTIDHSVLLKRLSCSFGVAGNVISWIQSYLTGRTQSVRIGSHSSPPNPCSVGVPQGSVLGPLLFSLYTSPISTITNSHQSLSAAVRGRHATLCCSFASQLQPRHFCT